MIQLTKNTHDNSACVSQHAVTPAQTPPEYYQIGQKAFYRTTGVLLIACKEYTDPDVELLQRAQASASTLSQENQVSAAISRFYKSDAKKINAELKKNGCSLTEKDVADRLKLAVKKLIETLQVIEKKGGKVSFDARQLFQTFAQARNEFPEDAFLNSLQRRISAQQNNSTQHDPAAVFYQIKQTGQLPTPAAKAFKIFRLASNINTSIADLALVVQTDPAITARIIKTANSAFYKSLHPATSVKDAIVRLGLKMIKRISLGFSLLTDYKKGPCTEFDYENFWSESLARAVVARQIAEIRQSAFTSDEAFTVGLVSRIGRLAFATVYPLEYANILKQSIPDNVAQLCRNEREVFGIDHNELTAEMMADWRLPDIFCNAVRFQDCSADADKLTPGSPECELAHILQWPAKMSIILTRPTVKHSFLSSVINDADQIGIGPDTFAKRFDSIILEWQNMGKLLDVKTRQVRPWDQICAQIA